MTNVILITSCFWVKHMCTQPYVNIKKSATVTLSTCHPSPTMGRFLPPAALTLFPVWASCWDTRKKPHKNKPHNLVLQKNYTSKYKTVWKERTQYCKSREESEFSGCLWMEYTGRALQKGCFFTRPWRVGQTKEVGLMLQGRGSSRCQAPKAMGRYSDICRLPKTLPPKAVLP